MTEYEMATGAPSIPFKTPTRAGFWQVIKEDLFSVCPSSQYSFMFSCYTFIILMVCDSLMTRKSGASSISPITEWIGSTNFVGNLASQFTHSSWKSLLFDSVALIACVSVIRPFINQRTLFVIYIMAGLFAAGVDCARTRTTNRYRDLSRDESIITQVQIQENFLKLSQSFRRELTVFLRGEGTWQSAQDRLQGGSVLYTKMISIGNICEPSFRAGGPS